jgi:mannose-6-phosphate isomerase-like protein (cupin superfamily)
MKHKILSLQSDFEVAFAVRKVQAAEMTLAPGSNTGGPDNRHRGADQWMYVVSGNGVAIVDGVRQPLQAGSLLVIEYGETHEIRCGGDEPLRTINFYSPPAYDDDGQELPAGES